MADDNIGAAGKAIRVAFILPGLHRVARGAEVAFESIGNELAGVPGFAVTLIGSGTQRAGTRYRFIHSPCTPRERFEHWPRIPPFRNEYAWEEATFAARIGGQYDPDAYDAVVTCSYPFLNWMVRTRGGHKPRNVFVTQNGDWPIHARNSEYRFFNCDALVCTNSVYFERYKSNRPTWLIPNGVDPARFESASPDRDAWGLPASDLVVLIVSALIPSKRVLEGIRALAPIPGIQVIVAGDGPLRDQVDGEGEQLLGERFRRVTVPFERMPNLYRSADVLLHMSEDEPFGNVYVEATAGGLPVVAHDWSSTRWLFDGEGFLVDTNNAAKVREAVNDALRRTTKTDKERRLNLVQRRFTWNAVAHAYAECLRSVAPIDVRAERE